MERIIPTQPPNVYRGLSAQTVMRIAAEHGVGNIECAVLGIKEKFLGLSREKVIQRGVEKLNRFIKEFELEFENAKGQNFLGIHDIKQFSEEVLEEITKSPAMVNWLRAIEIVEDHYDRLNDFSKVERDKLSLHSYEVAALAGISAIEVNRYWLKKFSELAYTREELKQIITAGFMHDIGKIAQDLMPIWTQPRRLSRDERAMMQDHTIYGAMYLAPHESELGKNVIESVLYHHERPDGTGYFGMKDKEVGIIPKVLAVTDKFTAMYVDRRRYRGGPVSEFWEGMFLAEIFGYENRGDHIYVPVPWNYPDDEWGRVAAAYERLFNGHQTEPGAKEYRMVPDTVTEKNGGGYN